MEERRVADIKRLRSHTPVHREIEVTLIDEEQLAHMWPKERLMVTKKTTKKIGDLVLQETAVRFHPQEGQSDTVLINHAKDGTITMEDLPPPEKKKSKWFRRSS